MFAGLPQLLPGNNPSLDFNVNQVIFKADRRLPIWEAVGGTSNKDRHCGWVETRKRVHLHPVGEPCQLAAALEYFTGFTTIGMNYNYIRYWDSPLSS